MATVEQPAAAARPIDAAALHAVRRLDWRFLLPSIELGVVGYLGPSEGSLPAGLAAFSRELAPLNLAGDGDARLFKLIVVSNPTRQALRTAVSRLADDGVLYVEAQRRRGPVGSPAAHRKALAELGLSAATAHWHWPDFESCAELAPLDSPAALDLFFSRRRGGSAARWKAIAGRALARSGCLGPMVRCFSLLASKPRPGSKPQADGASPPAYLQKFLAARATRLAAEHCGLGVSPGYVLVTPRFHASSHVVWLLLAERSSEPAVVVKMPRLDGVGESLSREADNLQALQTARPSRLASAPFLLSFGQACGRPILVETALRGRPVDAKAVRARLDSTCQGVLQWLRDVCPHDAPATMRSASTDWYGRLVDAPLRELTAALGDNADDLRKLAEATRLTRTLAGARLPLVMEHGDLSPPNLLLLRDGGVGAVDWELADPQGLPACDLFFFLTYAAFARRGARAASQYVAAFHEAFLERRAWGRRYVADYCAQHAVAPEWLTPLFALCWTRYLAGLLRRTRADGDDRPGRVANWLRSNRYYALWQHTLEHAGQLDWLDLPHRAAGRQIRS